MEIKVFSEEEIEKFITEDKHILISVRSPKSNPADLPKLESRLDTLFLDFHDIDDRCLKIKNRIDCDVCDGSGYIPEWKHIESGRCYSCNSNDLELKLFCATDAKRILMFVKKYMNQVDFICVNCEAGISRSAGIAGALSKIYNKEDSYYFKHFCLNMFVYTSILKEYYEA